MPIRHTEVISNQSVLRSDAPPKLGAKELILTLRPDLCRRLGFDRPEHADDYLSWLLTSGVSEYAILREPKAFFAERLWQTGFGPNGTLTRLQYLIWRIRPDVQQAFPLPDALEQLVNWFYTHGLEEHNFWHLLSDTERKRVLSLPEPWRSRLSPLVSAPVSTPNDGKSFNQRPFGVNLIGYAFGQLGIGEDARMAARALLVANVPMTMLNFPPGKDIPQNDHSMEAYVTKNGDYSFNMFCMTALENGRYWAERGQSQFKGRYNIGYWPWELGRWPDAWRDMTALVDEVWVSSRHTCDALSPVSPVPVQIMPMAVDLGSVSRKGRRQFGLPNKPYLFCFSFDLNSSMHRKNPKACIEAFARAFPTTRYGAGEVGLVIKTHRPARRNREWDRLKESALSDSRIHIIEETLSRPELLALYKACDCFVSLHRAEGFGRGIAEALLLGLQVIATAYSGNIDFCKSPQAHLVDYRLVKVKKGQYPFGVGQLWAEPDIDHAASLMRQLRDKSDQKNCCSVTANWQEFSPSIVGRRYLQRLEYISGSLTNSAEAPLAGFS